MTTYLPATCFLTPLQSCLGIFGSLMPHVCVSRMRSGTVPGQNNCWLWSILITGLIYKQSTLCSKLLAEASSFASLENSKSHVMFTINLESRTVNTHDCIVWFIILVGFREKINYHSNRADTHYGTPSWSHSLCSGLVKSTPDTCSCWDPSQTIIPSFVGMGLESGKPFGLRQKTDLSEQFITDTAS